MSGPASPEQFPKWDYQEYPKTLAREDFWSDGQAMIRGGDGKRDPVGPTVQQDPVAIDPATLDVLNVVMSDEDIGLFRVSRGRAVWHWMALAVIGGCRPTVPGGVDSLVL